MIKIDKNGIEMKGTSGELVVEVELIMKEFYNTLKKYNKRMADEICDSICKKYKNSLEENIKSIMNDIFAIDPKFADEIKKMLKED